MQPNISNVQPGYLPRGMNYEGLLFACRLRPDLFHPDSKKMMELKEMVESGITHDLNP